jgi:CheY-like chemotaxis protein
MLASQDRSRARGQLALVAEDEPHVRRLICAALHDVGFDVIEASNGLELDEWIRRMFIAHVESRAIDVIVADYHMPVVTGLEALAHLRAADAATPFILITALSDDAVVIEARRLGAAVLEKPFDLRALAAVASQASGNH